LFIVNKQAVALSLLAILLLAIASVFLLLTILYKMPTLGKKISCFFYARFTFTGLQMPAYCNVSVVRESITLKNSSVNILAKEILSYAYACHIKSREINIKENITCYEIFLEDVNNTLPNILDENALYLEAVNESLCEDFGNNNVTVLLYNHTGKRLVENKLINYTINPANVTINTTDYLLYDIIAINDANYTLINISYPDYAVLEGKTPCGYADKLIWDVEGYMLRKGMLIFIKYIPEKDAIVIEA